MAEREQKGDCALRLFIAIRFSKEILDTLLRAQEQLRRSGARGNFSAPENLHLTLAFLGETSDVVTLCRVIDRAAGEAFPLAVSGAGRFGELWWAGVEKNPALEALAERLREGCRRAGFHPDEKPFRAHVTLARQLQYDAPPRLHVPRTEMTVRRVSLMKSERVGGKLTYTEVYGRDLD